MSWDDLVESVAFGKTAPKLKSTLGMFLSPDTIYIAQTQLDRTGKLGVEHLVRIPVPIPEGRAGGTLTGTLNTSFLTENQKLGALIQQSMSQFRWSTRHVMVTVSHHLGLLRYFTMPAIERRFWKTAVPMEAKKYIPIPFEALSYDYQCIPLPADAGNRARQGNLITVTQKQNLAHIAAMLQGLGLTIAGMEVASCSVLKLWQTLDRGASAGSCCQVHFDGGNARILLADRGLPVFFREVFLGEEADVTDQRKLDLGGCLAFAQKQLAVGAVNKITISGSTPSLPAWKAAFAQELGLPVAIQDTAAMLGIKSGDWGGYSAIGASLRHQAPGPVTLDLGAVGRVSEDEKSVARDILLAGAALTLFFLLNGAFSFARYALRAREFQSLHRDTEIEAVFKNKSDDDIQDMFKKMRAQSDLAQAGVGPARVKMIDLLKCIIDALPEKAFLEKMTISRPLGVGPNVSPSLSLAGHAVAEDTAREQDLSFQFRDRLLSTGTVAAKLFPQVKVTVQGTVPGPDTGAATSSEAFMDRLETRTSFLVSGGKGI